VALIWPLALAGLLSSIFAFQLQQKYPSAWFLLHDKELLTSTFHPSLGASISLKYPRNRKIKKHHGSWRVGVIIA
jgi:hypothetical protein